MIRVLVADDDSGLRLSVESALQSAKKFLVETAQDGQEAIDLFRKDPHQVVLLDVDMPRANGIEVLRAVKDQNPGAIVIVMTAYATVNQAVQAVKEGAYNYLSKPVDSDHLIALIDRALEAQNMISNIAASAPILMENGRKIVGHSEQMVRVFGMVHRLAKVDTPVLVRGASGTGKELVARAIHFNSARKDGKFVAINCSAIPENLFESELFGHEKGAFTGADQRKIGKFQFAEGGTLFLDEVGDLPALMQVKLLRVLQERAFTPVGANREVPTNVRIIAATNRPLEDMMKTGSFREDLFYRLNVIPIFLPSLGERKGDLPNLIRLFIKKFNEQQGRQITGVTSDALAVLNKYDWPGNIRELENVIEHAFVMEPGKVLGLRSLPPSILAATGTTLGTSTTIPTEVANSGSTTHTSALTSAVATSQRGATTLGEGGSPSSEGSAPIHENNVEADESDEYDLGAEEVDESDALPSETSLGGEKPSMDFNAEKELFEREFIVKALKTFRGRINQTALHANIPKKTLLRKLEKYGIRAEEFRT